MVNPGGTEFVLSTRDISAGHGMAAQVTAGKNPKKITMRRHMSIFTFQLRTFFQDETALF
jgi:hypothetical protein